MSEPIKTTDAFNCPVCDGDIDMLADIQNAQPVKKGNIVVCGHCASILKIGDSSLVKVPKEEFQQLDKQSRFIIGSLVMTILGKRVGEKFKLEGRFN